MLATGLSHMNFITLSFVMKGWYFIKGFFSICWDDLWFYLWFCLWVYYIYWFAYVETSLHHWHETNLLWFMISLLCCWIWFASILLTIFFIDVHQEYGL
jgi:hypothetical protein